MNPQEDKLRRDAAELVTRSRAEQGLPATVEDDRVLERVATLARSSRERRRVAS